MIHGKLLKEKEFNEAKPSTLKISARFLLEEHLLESPVPQQNLSRPLFGYKGRARTGWARERVSVFG